MRSISKQRITTISLLLGLSVTALLLGIYLPDLKWRNRTTNLLQGGASANIDATTLTSLSVDQRQPKLEKISQFASEPLNKNRATYLLATDQLSKEPAKAIALLENLGNEYPEMSAYIDLKQAQAYEKLGDQGKTKKAWQDILQNHPKSAVKVNALYALGKSDPKYWQQAIEQFPAHPLTLKIIEEKLKKNPDQFKLWLTLAEYGSFLPNYNQILNQLTSKYADQLTPENWQMIAHGYWEKGEYGSAAIAYDKAPNTPENFYRQGRGLWLDGKVKESREVYKKLINTFPDDQEYTGLALIRLSRLSEKPQALQYLDQVIAKYPQHTPQALFDKSKLLDQLKSTESASQTRKWLLDEFKDSEPAAELRWSLAEQAAQGKNYQAAWQWAQELTQHNPESDLAPRAAFWVGKWANQLGEKADAQKAFAYTVYNYPQSYYAWRSAQALGWPVGDFTTVRSLSPEVIPAIKRSPLPKGSATLQELYQLGQVPEAWQLWNMELLDRQNLTVAEQYTDGALHMERGDYLEGIWLLSSLKDRDKPQDRDAYLKFKHSPAYWQVLYPFPYQDLILKWSKERNLNPVLVTALMRQESRFMPKIKSVVGATGLMQLMPETAKSSAQIIKLPKYDLENPNDNINLGTYYLGFTHDEYDNNSMLAVASYNAGPNAVSGWLKRFGFTDPDQFVEKIPYPETRGYVESVFENYWNYLRIYNPEVTKMLADHAKKYEATGQ